MKLCKDCRHYVKHDASYMDKCRRWQTVLYEPVRGVSADIGLLYCDSERSNRGFSAWFNRECGKKGRFWTPRPEGKEGG